jgi:hypothetical protein
MSSGSTWWPSSIAPTPTGHGGYEHRLPASRYGLLTLCDLAVLATSRPNLETKYFFPWIRCTFKEIMKIYALLGILMLVERRTTFGTPRVRDL